MGNLHLVTGYQGTEHVTAADHGSLYAAIFGSGSYVLDRGNKLAATVVTNNQIRIADGDIILQGRHIRLNEGATVDLTIENGAQGYYRNDLICVRYTRNSGTGVEEASLVVIKGTAVTASPSDPDYNNGDLLTDNAETVDFPLYRVPLSGITVQPLVALFKIIPAYGEGGLDYVPNDEKGKANGVATLNSSGKVPTSQLPSMNYIPTSQKGAASGVAPLNASKKLDNTYLGIVPVANGGTGSNGENKACNNIKAFFMDETSEAVSEKNLDNMKKPGVYRSRIYVTTNVPPYWDDDGTFIVCHWSTRTGWKNLMQVYRCVASVISGENPGTYFKEYTRYFGAGSWTEWEETKSVKV